MTELLIKLIDLLFNDIITRRRERKFTSAEFEALKREVLYEMIMNNVPAKLKQVRSFLIAKGLVEHAGFNEFYSKWLTDPIVEMGIPVANAYSMEKLNELRKELGGLQL